MRSFYLLLCLLVPAIMGYSQNTIITGNIKNAHSNEAVPSASVTIKGTIVGTFTDAKGDFKLQTKRKPPFVLSITSVSFESKEVAVSTEEQLNIALQPTAALGSEVVVSASRVPERIMESPVSIERVNTANIRIAPATSYYDIIGNLKGVDMTTSSLTFKTPSTRGFNTSGNTRLNQIVDGMDNQAPGMNFSVGSVIGLTELDVESVELLGGASSALYGPGGMNGTILINSKDPFKYSGLSVQVKGGIMNINNPGRNTSAYQDYSLRWAQKINDKFAFKLSAQYVQANDWVAYDSSNYSVSSSSVKSGTRQTDPNYNGVNIYGDETTIGMQTVANTAMSQAPPAAIAGLNAIINNTPGITYQQFQTIINGTPQLQPLAQLAPFVWGSNPINNYFGTQAVSRTGYKETDVIDPQTKNLKLSGGLYYKITDNLVASISGFWGTGNTVYTSADRYSLKNMQMGQYKVELKSTNWFIRGYTTQENAGDSYNATVATQLTNEAWKASQVWFPQYIGAYVQAKSMGLNEITSNNAARGFADQGRPAAGSDQFKQLFNDVVSKPIPKGGLFVDRSDLYMVEGQYNISDLLKLENKGFDLLLGGNWKQYVLNSQGTLFVDTTGPIRINEIGAYAQISKKLFGEFLKLTASGRYDKNDNFEGKFTPRFSAVVQVVKDHNIRLSYQTAYRFPTTQNQLINLQTGTAFLIGGLPQLREGHHFDTNPVYTQSSYLAFAGSGDASLLQEQEFGTFKPETSNSYEIGYKGLFANKLLVDAYGYYAHYKDFIGRLNVFQSSTGTPAGLARPTIYSVSVNSTNSVNTYGYGISLEYLLKNNFSVKANFYSDEISDVPANFQAQFNTPKYRTNIGIANSGFGWQKRIGFNVIYRWQDYYYNESTFVNGNVSAFSTVDAQVSFKLPKVKSLIKIGGTNITNHYYINSYGNPSIGALYYVSLGFNVL